ncbi:MAG: response regulator, partial [Hyphomicrobiaceae bacterium]
MPALFEGRRFLCVEDDQLNQELVRSLLKYYGADVDVAGNGLEAIEVLKAGQTYDLILLDVMMPGLDGFGVLEWIANRRMPVRVVIMTNMANDASSGFRAAQLGACDYLSKPFKDLERSVARALSHGRTVRDQLLGAPSWRTDPEDVTDELIALRSAIASMDVHRETAAPLMKALEIIEQNLAKPDPNKPLVAR